MVRGDAPSAPRGPRESVREVGEPAENATGAPMSDGTCFLRINRETESTAHGRSGTSCRRRADAIVASCRRDDGAATAIDARGGASLVVKIAIDEARGGRARVGPERGDRRITMLDFDRWVFRSMGEVERSHSAYVVMGPMGPMDYRPCSLKVHMSPPYSWVRIAFG